MSNSPLVRVLPHREANFDMYVRAGVYSDWDLGIRAEVREAYFWDLLRADRFTHILDIGAHIGFYTATALGVWPDAQYVAVEPERENFGVLALNLARFPNVQMMYGAMVENPWGYTGQIFKAKENSGGHLVRVFKKGETPPEEILDDRYTPQGYYLPLFAFQNILEVAFEASPRSLVEGQTKVLVKMDCEGAEWGAIASPQLSTFADCVIGEYHYPLSEFAAHMEYYLKGRFNYFDYKPLGIAQGLFIARKG